MGLAGCDKATPAGASVGTNEANETQETSTVERVKSQTASNSGATKVEVPAGVLIFGAVSVELPSGLDRALARKGASAFSGGDAEQLGQVMALASRPVVAWPVNPLDDQAGAKRWGATVAASVVIADKVAGLIAGSLPVRSLADEAQAKDAIKKAFAGLDHAGLMQEVRSKANDSVTLDLADGGAIRLLAPSGVVSLDGDGVKLSKGGAVSFVSSGGVFGGRSFTVALEKAGSLIMTRQGTTTVGQGLSQSKSTTAEAGVK